MAAFRRDSYDSTAYNEFMPVYPDDLYTFVTRFRGGKQIFLAADVATGTGQVARALRDHKGGIVVQKVLAFDPSDTMLQVAKETERRRPDRHSSPDVEYSRCTAEKICLPNDAVDLVTVGQAAHWFDMRAFWKEAARVLKPGGTLAIFAVAVPVLSGNAEASQLLVQLAHGHHHLGPYWEEPAKTLAHELYIDDIFIPPPDLFDRSERHVQTGDGDDSTSQDAPLLSMTMALSNLTRFLKTWPSYHKWKREHPDAPVDIVDECANKILACIEAEHDEAEKLAGSMFLSPERVFDPVVKVVWPLVLILAERRK